MSIQLANPTDRPKILMKEKTLFFFRLFHAILKYVFIMGLI